MTVKMSDLFYKVQKLNFWINMNTQKQIRQKTRAVYFVPQKYLAKSQDGISNDMLENFSLFPNIVTLQLWEIRIDMKIIMESK